jgi:DNA gyrase subunit A
VISIQVTERNGRVIGAEQVIEEDDVMLISDGGTLVRIPANSVSLVGRNTQGVRLINLQENEKLVAIEKIDELESDNEKELENDTTTL